MMKETFFIDTGYWIALFDRRDNHHPLAKNSIRHLLNDYSVFLSDFIIFETLTYLNCTAKRHDLALRFLEKAEKSGIVIVEVDKEIKNDALNLFRKYSDKDLSITDCSSFVVMNQKGIRNYAGFDKHFKQMGFESII